MSDISLRYLLFGEDRSASKAVKGVGTAAHSTADTIGGAFGKLGGVIGGEMGAVLDKIGQGLQSVGDHGKKMSDGLIVGGSAITGVGAALTMIGAKEKQATDQLRVSVEDAGGSYSDYADDIEKAVKTQERHAHSAAETKQALATLVTATGSTDKALKYMNVTADIAAKKHIGLSEAAGITARILSGNGSKALREFGVQMGKGTDKVKLGADAIDQLSGKIRGQADAAVDNWGGRIHVLSTTLGDWAGQMGQKVGPALTALGPLLAVTGAGMQIVAARNAAAAVAQDAEAGATVTQTVAQKAAAIASKGWAAAQWLLNAALDANPIALVVIAVAGLVAIFIVAWKHSQMFRDIVIGALHAVAGAFEAVWGWIKDHWPLLLAILTGPIGLAVLFIVNHFNAILTFIEGLPAKIAIMAVGMWDGIKEAFREAINWILVGWNHLHFRIPGFGVGPVHFGGFNLGLPQVPYLAAGGIVTRPTLAMIGEAGPEAVVPLSRGRGFGGTTMHVTFQVNGVLTREGAREVDRSMRELYRETGGALGYASSR